MPAKNFSHEQIYWIQKWKETSEFYNALRFSEKFTIDNCLEKNLYGGKSISKRLNTIREKWIEYSNSK